MSERRFPPPWTVEVITRRCPHGEGAHPGRGTSHRHQNREAATLARQGRKNSKALTELWRWCIRFRCSALVFGSCFSELHVDNHLVYEFIEGLAAFH